MEEGVFITAPLCQQWYSLSSTLRADQINKTMATLKLNFTPDRDVINGLAIYCKKLITETSGGIATTDIKKDQCVYTLPIGIHNKYKVYIKDKSMACGSKKKGKKK